MNRTAVSIQMKSCPSEKNEVAVSALDDDSPFPTVFYRGNVAQCGHKDFRRDPKPVLSLGTSEWMFLPMYSNGVAAGPSIDCTPSMVMNNTCDVDEKFNALETVRAFRERKAFQFFLPFQDPNVYTAAVANRARIASSSGVVFLDENHLAVASLGNKKVYLYEYYFSEEPTWEGEKRSYVRLLDSIDATGDADLIDADLSRNLLVISQFFPGTQMLLKFDLKAGKLSHYKEVYAFGPAVKNQSCHDVAFYPSMSSSAIAATSNNDWTMRDTLMISFYDYEKERVLAQFMMQSHEATRGFKAKGLRFIDKRHLLVGLTNNKVTLYSDQDLCKKTNGPKSQSAQNRLVLFRMNFSVDDIVADKAEPASSLDFNIIDVFDIGVGGVDGLAYVNGSAVIVDQMNDQVLVFQVDVNAPKPLTLASSQRGYLMPHGVSISKKHAAVTCYGDNSVILRSLADMTSSAEIDGDG